MQILKTGSRGPDVQLLQLALHRAGFDAGSRDGFFGPQTAAALRHFQRFSGLVPDGVVGQETQSALQPWLLGAVRHRIAPGDTLWQLALRYGAVPEAVATANPGIDPLQLQAGSTITIPLDFPLIPTDIAYTSKLIALCVEGLGLRYPFLRRDSIGRSVLGRPLHRFRFGAGENTVLYNAAHHGNEWITVPLLLKFTEELCAAYAAGRSIAGISAAELYTRSSIWLVPAVNPDGIDVATGALRSGRPFDAVREMAASYPDIPFPQGWKANIRGVDLNLQYPAGWAEARAIKFDRGYTAPGPRDYVGGAPLQEPESRAMAACTEALRPALTLSYHTQGEVIYWKYAAFEPPCAAQIGRLFSARSGYALEDTPYSAGFAGYKDWFIQESNRPGYTIECGFGENPLPITQFPDIYAANLGILTNAAQVTDPQFGLCNFASSIATSQFAK